jgi:hypothetical protein
MIATARPIGSRRERLKTILVDLIRPFGKPDQLKADRLKAVGLNLARGH